MNPLTPIFFSTHLATMEEVPESWCGVHPDQRKQMDKYKVLSGVEGREAFAEVSAMFVVWTSMDLWKNHVSVLCLSSRHFVGRRLRT